MMTSQTSVLWPEAFTTLEDLLGRKKNYIEIRECVEHVSELDSNRLCLLTLNIL
jgi:hypothetical protein